MPLDRDPTQALAMILHAHGVDVCPHPGDPEWLALPRGVRARGALFDRGCIEGRQALQLDVLFEPWTGCVLIESCAGFGEDRDAAMASAWQSFVVGSLHVLLATLLYHETDQVDRVMWDIDGMPRAVTLGGVVCRGARPHDDGWLRAFETAVQRAILPGGLHWIRLFHAQVDGETAACEVLLDNHPWEEVHEPMSAFPWPRVDGYSSVRLFLVVQGGVDVRRAMATLLDHADREDDHVAAELVKLGYDLADARLLVALVPLAVGRVVLSSALDGVPLRFPATAVLITAAGEEPLLLDEDPFFVEASFLAQRSREVDVLPDEHVRVLALRSPELGTIERAIRQGLDPRDVELSPPRIALA